VVSLEKNAEYVSKCFDIFRDTLEELRVFYENTQPTDVENPACALPNPSYRDNTIFEDGFDPTKLSFVKRVAHGDIAYMPTLWEATYDGKGVYVKFTETYHKLAHETLAQHNPPLAPKLYFADKIRGGAWMVVMEKLCGRSAELEFDKVELPESVQADVRAALDALHNHKKKLVFGDLRRPNIMVHRNSEKEEWRAKLVDFDCCGRDCGGGEPEDKTERWRYNCYLRDFGVAGMRPGAMMRTSHDMAMLDRAITVNPRSDYQSQGMGSLARVHPPSQRQSGSGPIAKEGSQSQRSITRSQTAALRAKEQG
jgi:hypothetical protein